MVKKEITELFNTLTIYDIADPFDGQGLIEEWCDQNGVECTEEEVNIIRECCMNAVWLLGDLNAEKGG